MFVLSFRYIVHAAFAKFDDDIEPLAHAIKPSSSIIYILNHEKN